MLMIKNLYGVSLTSSGVLIGMSFFTWNTLALALGAFCTISTTIATIYIQKRRSDKELEMMRQHYEKVKEDNRQE